MDSRALPSTSVSGAPSSSSAGAAPKTTKLNPTAKSFVFSVSAPAWTPTKIVTPPAVVAAAVAPPAPAAAPAPVAVAAAPVVAAAPASPVAVAAAPVVAPAPAAPLTPVKPSVLKPSARAFVPSVFAPAFVPSFAIAAPPAPAAPVASAAPPASPVKTSYASVVVSAAATAAAVASPASSTTAEPEAEELSQEDAPTSAAATDAVAVEEEPVKATAFPEPITPEKEEIVVEQESAQPTEDAETTLEQQTAAVGERIMYTIAQLLEMEPETCPMPPSVLGTQVMSGGKNGKDGEAAAAGSDAAGGKSARGKEPRGGSSSRSLHRSNSSFGDDGGRGSGRGGRGGRGNGRGGRGGRGGNGYHSQHSNNQPEIALEDVVPLNINEETRWKPQHAKKSGDDASADHVDTTEISLKEAKSILNKLSIEKFDKLSDQLIDVAVRSVDVLSGVIDMVIAKAQNEWHFSTMYASLCSKIAQTEMPAMALDSNEVAQDTHKLFRKLLLTRCQKEFEVSPSRDGWDELSDADRAEKELLLKRATLGHIRFVGELFKQRMLSSRIMHACVQRLFGDVEQPDEESLECMCKLLATIGESLESSARDQNEMNLIAQYYGAIKKLAGDSDKLCTRVRFMLQDLLDLRKNKWVTRRKETKAMTIAEIHAEAAKEEKAKAKASAAANNHGSGPGSQRHMLQRSHSSSSNASSGGGDKRRQHGKDSGSGSGGGGASAAWKARAAAASGSGPASAPSGASSSPSVDADGWETAGTGSRPKLLKARSSVLSAGSSTPPPRHASLARNSSDGSVQQRNSFSMLRQQDARGSRDRSLSSSSSSRRGSQSQSQSSNGEARPPRHDAASVSATSPSKTEDEPREELSADAFKKKVKSIFEEFVELQDLDEAVACLTELRSSSHHALIISTTMDIGLEKGPKQRAAVGKLLAGLFEKELLDTEAFATAVHEQLEFAEDMEIDIPLTLSYLAEMLAPSAIVDAVAPAAIVKSVAHMAETGKAAKFVALLLAAMGDETKARAFVAQVEVTELLRDGERTPEALAALYETYALQFLLE